MHAPTHVDARTGAQWVKWGRGEMRRTQDLYAGRQLVPEIQEMTCSPRHDKPHLRKL